MTLRWMRLGFVGFFLLSFALAANLTLFQPLRPQQASARAVFPPASEPASPIATGSVVILNASNRTKPLSIEHEPKSGGESAEVVRAVQRELLARGYETGSADGMPGLITRASIMAYESDHDLPLTGVASDALLHSILLGASNGPRKGGTRAGAEPGREAGQVIRTVQQSLASLGYRLGQPDGRLGEQTVRTIREFETDQGLAVSGRISGQLVARLARLAGQGRLADGR
jgi:peptidoglycan hydrolase-like protein with peptidoglycan-binding domain